MGPQLLLKTSQQEAPQAQATLVLNAEPSLGAMNNSTDANPQAYKDNNRQIQ